MKVTTIDSAYEKEPLIRPFGFKGGYLTEIWQSIVRLTGSDGHQAVGLGSQSVLWSDSTVFRKYSEDEGNLIMYSVTQRALEIIKGQNFSNPLVMLDNILDEVYAYARKVTREPDLRKTFPLNALVPVDNAMWLLYAREKGISSFDHMIPEKYRPAFAEQHDQIAAIPILSYGTTMTQLKEMLEEGYFFMKIKIGQPGTQEEMLEKDRTRLTQIHRAIGHYKTPHTPNGKLPYYFDANGRYETKKTFLKFLEHAKKIGAFEQIALIEEPFPEELKIDVSDIPVRLAADESAHTDADAQERIQMGYRAIALKPIAKTLSMTMKIAKTALEQNIPCFCADLTVNPVLVEWNKNIAARLKPFPGLEDMGLLESNGHQNYKNWDKMLTYLPTHNKPWVDAKNGQYLTGKAFFETGGGIFSDSPHYKAILNESAG